MHFQRKGDAMMRRQLGHRLRSGMRGLSVFCFLEFSFLAFSFLAWMICAAAVAEENPCTNGGFERLTPNGFPEFWGPVGRTVQLWEDAHSGKFSLRLLRTPDARTPETGLNRGWDPGANRPALITQLRGGVEFWYKAISAENARLVVTVIPMDEEPVERTGSPRATFEVPEEHIGDGKWHRGLLKYDFTQNPKVKWVHFAARIYGQAGELLLDDFKYLEQVGPLVELGTITLDEDPQQPGEEASVRIVATNAGDQPAENATLRLIVPEGLTAVPAEQSLGTFRPGERRVIRWTLSGRRITPGKIQVSASGGVLPAQRTFWLREGVRIRSFGPVSPVTFLGEAIGVECELENTGDVFYQDIIAELEGPNAKIQKKVAFLPPRQKTILKFELRPTAVGTFPLTVSIQSRGKVLSQTLISSLKVVPRVSVGKPAGRLNASVGSGWAVLENESLRCIWLREQSGFGPALIETRGASSWRQAAWMPYLSQLVFRARERRPLEVVVHCSAEPQVDLSDTKAELFFPCKLLLDGIGPISIEIRFALSRESHQVEASYRLRSEEPLEILGFDGPMLYALDRDEAVFPGLEWLVEDELSSDSLDIAEGHPDQQRYVVHPNMITVPAVGVHGNFGTVGLLWDVHQKWDGNRDRPAFVFGSPDRFNNQRGHLMGLFLPSVPEFTPVNSRRAEKGYPLKVGQTLELSARIFADGMAKDSLAAIEEYLRTFGLPDPARLPHGDYAGEIAFSMQAYLESLWDAQTQEWWTSKNGGILSQKARPAAFCADLLLGELFTEDEELKRACRQRAELVCKLIEQPPRLDMLRYGARFDLAWANPLLVANLLMSRAPDGTWRYDADREGSGPFVGKDYRDLGPHEALEIGICAAKATAVLRYARIAGDLQAYQAMLPTLERMQSFRVPRAAQVWEVPVHTPDVLAAAEAVEAFLEAYRFSGERRWLEEAVLWARRGLPFIYLWADAEKPFLLGASIPVFGATWYEGSWFGRPVQWNGLRYAEALLALVKYDRRLPWDEIARLIVTSAIHQQDQGGENVALWPDNISAIDAEKCPWVFAPRQIIDCLLKLMDRDPEPQTTILSRDGNRLHLSSTVRLQNVRWEASRLELAAVVSPGEPALILVTNIDRPTAVGVNGQIMPERRPGEVLDEPSWYFDRGYHFLAMRIPNPGPIEIVVEPARFAALERLPSLAQKIAFEFERSTEGWVAAHDISEFHTSEDELLGITTGGDPYLIRPLMRVPGDSAPVLYLRMKVSQFGGGQLFWATAEEPNFTEAKSIRFPVHGDGNWHEYRLELGGHSAWKGQTITSLRIDPIAGGANVEFAIDYLRAGLK